MGVGCFAGCFSSARGIKGAESVSWIAGAAENARLPRYVCGCTLPPCARSTFVDFRLGPGIIMVCSQNFLEKTEGVAL